ncbi:hypothetical protein [Ulvibacter antarcticus]|nr:hypothetical protein [Ulvibacter antarcticus]
MKKNTSLMFSLTVLFALLLFSTSIEAQVGVNTTNPTEMLHVNGNVRIDGDFRPGNAVGGVDQILLSQGTGVPPVWGPGFINSSQITSIAKFYAGPLGTITSGFYYAIPIPDPAMTANSTVEVNVIGALPAGPAWGYDFTILPEPQNGQLVLHITNVSGFDITGLSFSFIIYYN